MVWCSRDGVKRQGGFPRTGDPREDDQPVAGKLEGNVSEVVLPRPMYQQIVGHDAKRRGGTRTIEGKLERQRM